MKINWAQFPMYNTIMALAAGTALLLIVQLAGRLIEERVTILEGYALAFFVTGSILFFTGLHMSLTWPLAHYTPFDNIIFGEPALGFGAMLLAAALFLWRKTATVAEGERLQYFLNVLKPVSWFGAAMGLGCFAIAAAGWRYTLFAAPPQEPISGNFADHPLIEATFISSLYVLVGIGAVLLPFALRTLGRPIMIIIGIAWSLAGIAFVLFGALNYFTHIGLVVNTM